MRDVCWETSSGCQVRMRDIRSGCEVGGEVRPGLTQHCNSRADASTRVLCQPD